MTVHWLTRPATLRALWIVFVSVLAVTVLAEGFIERHPHFPALDWLGFNAVYGFVTCAAMIVLSKVLGMWLKRRDDYYREDPPA